jgi:hypothetical protein
MSKNNDDDCRHFRRRPAMAEVVRVKGKRDVDL